MSQAVDKLLEVALALPDEEQLQLLTALHAAVEERGLRPFDDTWMAEIQRRSAEFDSGQVQPVLWEDVKARARERISGRA